MSLRSKIALILFTVVAGVLAVDNLGQRQLVGQAFSELEGQRARADLERMGDVFPRISRSLVTDPAPWLEAWTRGPEALDEVAGRPIDLRAFPSEAVAADHPALDPEFDEGVDGAHPSLMTTDHGLLVMGRVEVEVPGEGPGVLLLGLFVSPLLLDELVATGVGESEWYLLDGAHDPPAELAGRIAEATAEASLEEDLGLDRTDEIGQLGAEFDEMIEKLARSREASAQAARIAGRSELAVGVLHNVGNILNRVTTSAGLTRQHLASLSEVDFQVILGELQSHRGSLDQYLEADDRGRHLLSYFSALLDEQNTRVDEAVGEARALTDSVQQVVRLVASLNAFETDAEVESAVDLRELVESALEVTLPSEAGSEAVRIEREVQELGQVRIDRSRMLEVLVTLVRNAIQALEGHGGEGRVQVRVRTVEPSHFCVEVEDNGSGIPHEDLDRIFQLGFTTRPGGSGFGLHLAGNLVNELDGRLDVVSAGPGQGATFRVTLPLRRMLERAA